MHPFLFPIGTEIESIKAPWLEGYRVVGAFYDRNLGGAFYQLQLAEHKEDELLELSVEAVESYNRLRTSPLDRFDSNDRVIAVYCGTPNLLGWVDRKWPALSNCIDLTSGETEITRYFPKHVKGWTFVKVQS